MDERFIKWLNIFDEFHEGTVLRDILNDAIRCYRNGIARPALMLSYVAFMQAVKNNLLKSEMPKGFKESRWKQAMLQLRNDTKWEEAVMTCIKLQKNNNAPAYFDIPNSLREDVDYWRHRRNDCAHYKDSEISLSHVCAFWIFMMDNYNKFTPLGSLSQSINDYLRHYDISRTPQGMSDEHIFKRLCLAVKSENDLKSFLKETCSVMGIEQQFLLLHRLMIDERHRDKVKNLLKTNKKQLKPYLYFNPKDVSLLLGGDEDAIRKFWYDDFQVSASCVNVYVEMLRANMIPKTQIKESLVLLLKNRYDRGSFFIEPKDDFKILVDNGLYDLFITIYLSKDFVCSDPGGKCRKIGFYIPIIMEAGITDKLVQTLADSVQGNFPYTLTSRLKEQVFSVQDNKDKYFEIIEKLQLYDFLGLKNSDENK